MAGMYWLILIPLVLVAVAIGVVPVLYGTLKHEHWERNEATRKERQRSGEIVDSVDAPRVQRSDLHLALQDARAEARALLLRIEHLERVGGSSQGGTAAEAAGPLATAGRVTSNR
jgi:hypothetical protein